MKHYGVLTAGPISTALNHASYANPAAVMHMPCPLRDSSTFRTGIQHTLAAIYPSPYALPCCGQSDAGGGLHRTRRVGLLQNDI